jgi:hypothetical protein
VDAQRESHIPDRRLNWQAAYLLHCVPTGATYEDVMRCLRIPRVTTTWKQRSALKRKEGPSLLGNPDSSLPPSTIWLTMPMLNYANTFVKKSPMHVPLG